MKDSSVKRWSRFHSFLFRATRGRLGDRLVNNDMMLLTTTGRKTGTNHTVPLLYLTEDDQITVIASYGGRDSYPDWYLNLVDKPEVTVRLPRQQKRSMVARTASSDERASWWPRIVEAYDGYATYQSRTDREIPVVILEPARNA